ncbi:MAG: matrixin family metalloprotease [Myxococcales bacterium]|nr:MAG: matrixin family metalloprotease [Myxococcales bacterium]
MVTRASLGREDKHMAKKSVGSACVIVALNLMGCSDGGVEGEVAPSGGATIGERELALGAQGGDVQALTAYLTRYGYFPNAELQETYPAWRPLVSEAPTHPGTFDARTEAALRAFQLNMGLPVTGVVDSETARNINSPRCGVPDGIAPLDPTDKFARIPDTAFRPGSVLNYTFTTLGEHPIKSIDQRGNITYDLSCNLPPVIVQKALLRGALEFWSRVTSLTFRESSTIPVSLIIAGGSDSLASTEFHTIRLNSYVCWDVTLMLMALSHEVGHALGLDHSSFSDAVMFPSRNTQAAKPLSEDDKVGISTFDDTFEQLPGTGTKHISVGADGSVWRTASNGSVDVTSKWDGSNWVEDGGWATRIAVGPDGVPWAIDASGATYQRQSSDPYSGGWNTILGRAAEIAIGPDGAVWKLDLPVADAEGNHRILRWNSTARVWIADSLGGVGVRIAVGPVGPVGAVGSNFVPSVAPVGPWVTQANGNVFRRKNGAWQQLPGKATDVAVSPGGYGWALIDGRLNAFGEQPLLGPGQGAGSQPPQYRFSWAPAVNGTGVRLAVGPDSRVWIVKGDGSLYRQVR